jgi:hypothetical protein
MLNFFIFLLSFFLLANGSLLFASLSFPAEKIPTKVIVRVVARDA